MTKFITVPNPILRKKSKPINKINKGILDLIKELKKSLIKAQDPPGVGLSAVQIDQLKRIFVARKDIKSEPKAFINPEITWRSKELTNGVPSYSNGDPTQENKVEGCLSVPGYYGLVKRAKKIKLKYYTLDAMHYTLEEKTQVFSNFLATVIQHELDHLNGVLFIDRVLKQGNKLYKMEDNELVEAVL